MLMVFNRNLDLQGAIFGLKKKKMVNA